MKLTLIHPCVGKRTGKPYLRGWQMPPLSPAVIAGLTPPDVQIAFYDDSLEPIPFDDPTDLVAMTVETYTAKRAYQIASDYRRRGVPVVMGGFQATLCPEQVSQYAEAVVIGEAENVWSTVVRDAERKTLQTYYQAPERPSLAGIRPARAIYGGKKYLPLGLVESGRGCHFQCEFCSVQTFHQHTFARRPIQDIVAEVEELRDKPLIFFVDDNVTANLEQAKELCRALIPLKIKWVSQGSIHVAGDEELLHLMQASGCLGLLIGFESLNPATLESMNKKVNLLKGGFEQALANLQRFQIRLYITFVFGYDEDTPASFTETLQFALDHKFYLAAFNHLVPFPNTPLYYRLQSEGRLLYENWWLEDDYHFNMVAFQPRQMTPEQLRQGCLQSRQAFYNVQNIWRRSFNPVHRTDPAGWLQYWAINQLFHREVNQRHHFPLGDEGWQGELVRVRAQGAPPPPRQIGRTAA
jgi:radical SAM superfamily enzyme YgiQ (UPF0313 family)